MATDFQLTFNAIDQGVSGLIKKFNQEIRDLNLDLEQPSFYGLGPAISQQ